MTPRRAVALLPVAAAVALGVLALPTGLAVVTAVAGVFLAAYVLRSEATPEAGATPTASTSPQPPRDDQARITALLDLFTEGILLLDAENTVIAANTAAARILGRPRDTMIGVSLIRAARDHVFLEVLRESAAEPREVQHGEQRVIFARATPVESDGIRTVLTLQDMTELRRAERARQDLVANVSHELRTPIAAALALAETLEGGVDDPEQRERFSRQLTSEVERLGRMVDRLLRLSRIESGTEEFRFEALAPLDLLEEAARRIGPVAERRGVRLECQVEPSTPAVHADRERVLEVLANLADNAVRHSPEGGTVSLSARPQEEAVRIDVRDQGPGVLPQDRLRIFERFYTGDRARSEEQGTGLGLSIARHIVSRHGGAIWVGDETEELQERGATLSFTLPQAPPPSEVPSHS